MAPSVARFCRWGDAGVQALNANDGGLVEI